MLDARALLYAVLVSLLIALVSAALIQLTYFMNLQQTDQFDKGRLIRNVNSGIALLQSLENEVELKTIDLYQDGKNKIQISRQNWGLLSVGTSTAYIRKTTDSDSLSKTVIFGDAKSDLLEYGLYVTDQVRPLSFVGDARIEGNVFLPKAGIKRGNIGGKTFTGEQMIIGKKKESKTYLPKLDWITIEKKVKMLQRIEETPNLPFDNLDQSFQAETFIFSNKQITLGNIKLKGNIIIKASEKIIIEHSCELEDVIVIAPSVIIKSGFRGSLQVFAKDLIKVEEDCYLEYPSILFLSKNTKGKDKTNIKVGSNTRIEGMILSYEKGYRKEPAHLYIAENTTIVGEVFVKGSVDLRGKILGSLSCTEFQVRTNTSVYNNYLLDGKIQRQQLHEKYASPLIETTTDWAVIKYIQ